MKRNKKEFFFLSGLPRSGETLLMAFLDQNPNIHAGQMSGCLDIMFNIRKQWDELVQHKEMAYEMSEEKKRGVLRGILDGYYAEQDTTFVIDNCRGWCAYIEMIEYVLGHQAKVLVTVRSPREILASLELKWRETHSRRNYATDVPLQMETIQDRCNYWWSKEQVLGLAYSRIIDAIKRGFGSRMYIIEYNHFVSAPLEVAMGIYDFLEIEPYKHHDSEEVHQLFQPISRNHAFNNLHSIRPHIKPNPEKWQKVLGEIGELYPNQPLSFTPISHYE